MCPENNFDQSCIFCRVIDRTIPATIIAENDDIIAIQDISPQAAIHYLIIPKKHIKDVVSFGKDDCCYSSKMFALAKKIAQDQSIDNFKLLVNNGYDAGQRIFHIHMHFLSDENK